MQVELPPEFTGVVHVTLPPSGGLPVPVTVNCWPEEQFASSVESAASEPEHDQLNAPAAVVTAEAVPAAQRAAPLGAVTAATPLAVPHRPVVVGA